MKVLRSIGVTFVLSIALLVSFDFTARAQQPLPDPAVVADLLLECLQYEYCLTQLEMLTGINFYQVEEVDLLETAPVATHLPPPPEVERQVPMTVPQIITVPVPYPVTEIVTVTTEVERTKLVTVSHEVPVTQIVTEPSEVAVTQVVTYPSEVAVIDYQKIEATIRAAITAAQIITSVTDVEAESDLAIEGDSELETEIEKALEPTATVIVTEVQESTSMNPNAAAVSFTATDPTSTPEILPVEGLVVDTTPNLPDWWEAEWNSFSFTMTRGTTAIFLLFALVVGAIVAWTVIWWKRKRKSNP